MSKGSEFVVRSSETKRASFDFENLTVYKDALDLASDVTTLMAELPAHIERTVGYQLSRASLSIALNVAEGSVYSKKQFAHYIDIARGSTRECVPCLDLLTRHGYLKEDEYNVLLNRLVAISRMLSGLKRSVTGAARPAPLRTPNSGLPTKRRDPRTPNSELRTQPRESS